MHWEFSNDRPIYSQIIEQITIAIASGELTPGEKLMSVRDLAAEATVNPNTMQKAFSELERCGLVTTTRTSGRFITKDEELIKKTKSELAGNEVKAFVSRLEQLGFTIDEIIELIKKS